MTDSIKSRTLSLSSIAKNIGDRAPISKAYAPLNTKCEAILAISVKIKRMCCALSGTSISINFSVAAIKGISFANPETQSILLTSVVICGYVLTSANFS